MSDNPYDAPQTESLELSSEIRNWAMFCHLSALIGMLAGVTMFAGPLIIWLVKKDEHPFIDEHGKEALNFQISMLLYMLLLAPTLCVVIGFVLLPALVILNVVFVVVAAMKASNGEAYRYPATIRLV